MGEMMGAKRKELGALAVSQINRRGINFVGGVTGLGLNVTKSGSRSWILRYQAGGKRKDMGLGGYPDVTLAQAKERARAARTKLADGIDPIEASQAARARLLAEQRGNILFRDAASQYIQAHAASWRNPKHEQQWRNTIDTYAHPKIGNILVRHITIHQVLTILEPIWIEKTETATRLRGRIESILDWAIVHGYRSDANPARWKGMLDKLLPAPAKVATTDHHKALPYEDLPAFMRRLSEHPGVGSQALQFAILTATRSGEVRHATWEEFDLEGGVWTIPATRMKAGREHRVPLSRQAIALLKGMESQSFCPYVFPSSHSKQRAEEGKPLSDMTLSAILRRMNIPAVPHGFRSTFRDWCAEMTDYPNEVAEMALAHTISNKVEAAYRRGDLFEKRKQLMHDWSNYSFSSKWRKS